jgi:hypothetical protein
MLFASAPKLIAAMPGQAASTLRLGASTSRHQSLDAEDPSTADEASRLNADAQSLSHGASSITTEGTKLFRSPVLATGESRDHRRERT